MEVVRGFTERRIPNQSCGTLARRQPVRAGDVVFSYGVYRDPQNASPYAVSLAGIDSVTATDSLTATIWFRRGRR